MTGLRLPRLKVLFGAAAALAAAAVVWLVRDPVVEVRVAADSFVRSRPDWEAVLRRRIEAVSEIYQRSSGLRWRAVEFVAWESTPAGSLDIRPRELRGAVGLAGADVLLGVTGRTANASDAETLPLADTAVAVIPEGADDRQAARIIARELAHLFGAPHVREPAGTLMDDPPGGDAFDPATARLIRDLRRRPFPGGPAALSGRQESEALAALARMYNKGKIKPEAQARYVLGVSCTNDGVPAAGIRHLREALRIDAEFHAARLELAGALYRDHQRDQAIGELRTLVSKGVANASAHASLANLLAATGQRREAVEQASQAVRKAPENPMLHVLLGRLLVETPGEFENGIAAIRQAVALAPNWNGAKEALAAAEAIRRRHLLLAERLRAAAAANPGDARLRNRLAMAQMDAGNLKAARAELETVLRAAPGNADAHANLAVLLFAERDYAGAWRELTAAQKLGRTVDARFEADIRARLGGAPK